MNSPIHPILINFLKKHAFSGNNSGIRLIKKIDLSYEKKPENTYLPDPVIADKIGNWSDKLYDYNRSDIPKRS